MKLPDSIAQEYQDMTQEIAGFRERLEFARSEGDQKTAEVMENEMNGSLDHLSDLLRAIGSVGITG